jgi:hypothetical protein
MNETESPVSYNGRALILRSGIGRFETRPVSYNGKALVLRSEIGRLETRPCRPPVVTGFTWLTSVSPGTYRDYITSWLTAASLQIIATGESL